MEFDDSKKKKIKTGGNYVVNIMYDKFFVRKQEIAENILMIAICDVEHDGTSNGQEFELSMQSSSFNIGQLDLLFDDYQTNFMEVEECIDEISK